MSDIYLGDSIETGTPNSDIILENGDLKLTSDVSKAEGIRQDVIATLSTFAGEYFLDDSQNYGVPYIQEIFRQKPISYSKTQSIISEAILGVSGVASIEEMQLESSTTTRDMLISFTAITIDGQTITANVEV